MNPDEPRDPPPHDIAAEQAVLGAMMLSAAEAERCLSRLAAEDFYRPAHGTVFAVIQAMTRESAAVDAVTVMARLEADGVLA